LISNDVRLDLIREIVIKDPRQVRPVLRDSVLLKVLLVVAPVLLIIAFVKLLFEVARHMFDSLCFVVLSECALSIL